MLGRGENTIRPALLSLYSRLPLLVRTLARRRKRHFSYLLNVPLYLFKQGSKKIAKVLKKHLRVEEAVQFLKM